MANENEMIITFNDAGAVSKVEKNFQLFVGGYQTCFIKVFVPKTLVQMIDNKVYTRLTYACKYIENGIKKSTRTFNMQGEAIDQSNYYVFRTAMPPQFLSFFGVGVSSPKLVLNIIQTDVTKEPNIVIRAITSGEIDFDVNESQSLNCIELETSVDYADPTNQVFGFINLIKSGKYSFNNLELMVSDPIADLDSTPNIDGFIEEVKNMANVPNPAFTGSLLQTYTSNVETDPIKLQLAISNKPSNKTMYFRSALNGSFTAWENILTDESIIEKLEPYYTKVEVDDIIDVINQDIADLKDTATSGKRYIGSITKTALPEFPYTQEFIGELNALAPNGELKDGDYVDLYVDLPNQKRSLYIIVYTTEWQKYDLQAPITKATNDRFGVLKGGVSENGIDVNIIDGQINDIVNVAQKKGIATLQNEFIDGTTPVRKSILSRYATLDDLGRPINTTYALGSEVYSKEESDKRYLSAAYNNIFYYAKNEQGEPDLVDTLPEKEFPQFEKTYNSLAGQPLFKIKHVLGFTMQLNKNSSDTSVLYISTDRPTTLKFRLETKAETKTGQQIELAYDESVEIDFQSNRPQAVTFNTIYNQLPQEEFEVEKGSILVKTLVVYPISGYPVTVSMYCNGTFPSTYQLDVKTQVISYNAILKPKKIKVYGSQFVEDGQGGYKFVITPDMHEQPKGDYIINCYYAKSSNVSEVANVTYEVEEDTSSIVLYTDYPEDYTILIASGVDNTTKDLLVLRRPTTLENIDYNKVGAIRIIANQGSIYLTLPVPQLVSNSYKVFVANSKDSTGHIAVNGIIINIGDGVEFHWVGEWVVGEAATDTSDVFDKERGQRLNTTLNNLDAEISRVDALADALDSTKADATSVTALETKVKNVWKYDFNQLFDTLNSTLPTANGLTITNIYGGHNVAGTTDRQYYHKMYALGTKAGHWYYFAPNFSDGKNVYILGHIDSTSFSTKGGKVFQGGDKFDIYIQIEKDKTLDFNVQPILIDLTEMFGDGNEPTTEEEVYQYINKDTYYPYKNLDKCITGIDNAEYVLAKGGSLLLNSSSQTTIKIENEDGTGEQELGVVQAILLSNLGKTVLCVDLLDGRTLRATTTTDTIKVIPTGGDWVGIKLG